MINFLKRTIRFIIVKFKFPKAKIALSAIISLDTKLESNGVFILSGCTLGSCTVGSYTYVGSNCNIQRTHIGSFTSIGSEVICGLGKHPINYISTYPGFYTNKSSGAEWLGYNHDFVEHEQVEIGSDVWIGTRAIILGGIKIGHGAVIGAGAIVTKDVPNYAIVAGVPAKIIRYRFEETVIKKIMDSKWWEFPINKLKDASKFANKPEDFVNYLANVNKE